MRNLISVVAVVLVTAGCATPPPTPKVVIPPPLNVRVAPDIVEMGATHRTSRYVTQSTVPARQVRDVLSSEMNVNIPSMPNATVGEGLGFLLKQTGYRVRPATTYAEEQLYQQSLPLMHMNMGYMSVRQALQVIGGNPWALEEDVVKREVGFTLREGYVWKNPAVRPTHTNNSENAGYAAHRHAEPEIERLFLTEPSSQKKAVAHSVGSQVKANSVKDEDLKQSVRYYVVPMGQSYLSALRQWAKDDGFTNVAWHLAPKTQQALENTSKNGETLVADSFHQLVFKLSKQIGEPLYFSQQNKLYALHSYPGLVDITWVFGDSLKSAVSSVAKAFEWTWDDNASWLALDDYQFLTPYPVVTPKGDIAHALEQVLEGYPVEAQLLYGTQQVFISEKQ
ncbi:PFGI-1 class ICE element type IV pilus protein PilL2 [Shewanella colwelliana]|uniref:PFGI-1 class ICE element type IV pilus protein PilL2 n=1 Tax=Shewanella colwelliana TaxID=23 RepID=UPI003736CADC